MTRMWLTTTDESPNVWVKKKEHLAVVGPADIPVTYKGKRTINLDSRGTVYLSKTMSIELGILGGGRVNFAHDDETGDWYICRADDSEGFIVWKDKRCARFSAGFIVQLSLIHIS